MSELLGLYRETQKLYEKFIRYYATASVGVLPYYDMLLERYSEADKIFVRRVLELETRIVELEEQVWDLNLANEKLESAYFADETIAPDGTLKPSARKLLERLEKAETDYDIAKSHVTALLNRIDELEAEGLEEDSGSYDSLIPDWAEVCIKWEYEDELPEGISDEVFSAMYACSELDVVRLYPYITIDGRKRFLIELPEDK